MAEERHGVLAALAAATLCLGLLPLCTANMVFYDGFTIEMPVWFELTPRLRKPVLVPYKDTAMADGHNLHQPTQRPDYPTVVRLTPRPVTPYFPTRRPYGPQLPPGGVGMYHQEATYPQGAVYQPEEVVQEVMTTTTTPPPLPPAHPEEEEDLYRGGEIVAEYPGEEVEEQPAVP